jgi:hypothetical protein
VIAADKAPDGWDPAEHRCDYYDDSRVGGLLDSLEFVDEVFPNVPPDDARYFKAESDRAKKLSMDAAANHKDYSQANQVYAGLESKPMYHIWKLRNALEEAKLALLRIIPGNPKAKGTQAEVALPTYPHNAEAEKLERAIRAVYSVNDFTRTMEVFC